MSAMLPVGKKNAAEYGRVGSTWSLSTVAWSDFPHSGMQCQRSPLSDDFCGSVRWVQPCSLGPLFRMATQFTVPGHGITGTLNMSERTNRRAPEFLQSSVEHVAQLQVMSHLTKLQFQMLGCQIGNRATWPCVKNGGTQSDKHVFVETMMRVQ